MHIFIYFLLNKKHNTFDSEELPDFFLKNFRVFPETRASEANLFAQIASFTSFHQGVTYLSPHRLLSVHKPEQLLRTVVTPLLRQMCMKESIGTRTQSARVFFYIHFHQSLPLHFVRSFSPVHSYKQSSFFQT